MKKEITISFGIFLWLAVWTYVANAQMEEAVVGKPAPDFKLMDTNGKGHALSELKGKVVVLEWNNPDCPFVKKHYSAGNMQELQKAYTGKGVVWFMINSSAPGKQGNYPPEKLNEIAQANEAHPTALLMDPDGSVGRKYGAKTTPHMFVIDQVGTLVYNGAIDDKPSTNSGDIAGAKNYVKEALDETLSGEPISTPSSPPYGCSVKY